MRRRFITLLIGSLIVSNTSFANKDVETKQSNVICADYSSQIESDMQWMEDHFSYENYQFSMRTLKETLPEWMEEAFQKNKEFPDLYDKLFQGDIFLAYNNHTNIIRGYVLKLRYMNAESALKEKARENFCKFLVETPIFD